VAKVLIVDSKLKVITVSSSGRVLQAGCPLGASVALRKPIDVTELVAAVRWTVQEQASAPGHRNMTICLVGCCSRKTLEPFGSGQTEGGRT
jgi:hypothetical protein